MKMSFRWFGEKDDTIPLSYIRQIPGVETVVGALYDVPVGEVWPTEKIAALKAQVEGVGLALEVIESVNVHDDIKIGAPTRDRWIENYRQTIRNLAEHGIKVICYNFMPVFDWLRTDLSMQLADGSYAMAYDRALAARIDPEDLLERTASGAGGVMLPGWEPERLADLRQLFEAYADVDETALRANLQYFLEAIIPVCEEVGITMAIHPDDPPHSLFGLPRVVKNIDDLTAIVDMVDSPRNALTVCTGSLGENPDNDVVAILRHFVARDRVAFVHARNIKWTGDGNFHESAHLSGEGSLDLYEIIRALYENGFDGYIRPDHGRMIWDEVGRPGYGLYDRALGIAYLNGLWEAVENSAVRGAVTAPQRPTVAGAAPVGSR